MIRTLRLKVKKPYIKRLNSLAREVNFVWNYLNDLSYYMIKNKNKWLSSYDMWEYLAGARAEGLQISAAASQEVARTYYTSRGYDKVKLRYRGRKTPGWIPFNGQCLRNNSKGLLLFGQKIKVFDSYGLENYRLKAGNLSCDTKGDWYLNVAAELPDPSSPINTSVLGVDLGLKTFATFSNGEKIEGLTFYKSLETKIGTASRAHKKRLFRSLHKKVQNRRKDFLHKLSTKLAYANKLIVMGDITYKDVVSLPTTRKALFDAPWYLLKCLLGYKMEAVNHTLLIVKEYGTSVTCSACKNRTGPQGLEGLRIREWTCSSCGSTHDRDVNAAINILALGRQSLAEGASC